MASLSLLLHPTQGCIIQRKWEGKMSFLTTDIGKPSTYQGTANPEPLELSCLPPPPYLNLLPVEERSLAFEILEGEVEMRQCPQCQNSEGRRDNTPGRVPGGWL